MFRRLEPRFKTELFVTLTPTQGNSTIDGRIFDISATHFRAIFSSEELFPGRRYGFRILLPDQQQIKGEVTIERFRTPNEKGVYIFIIENLPVDEERILEDYLELANKALADERRRNSNDRGDQSDRRSTEADHINSQKRRVVITGIGVVAPNAIGRLEFWKAIEQQKTGVRQIQAFDCSQFPVKIAGEVDNELIKLLISSRKASHMGRATQFGWIAAKLALEDAKFDFSKTNLDSVGVAMGTTLGTLDWAFEQYAALHKNGYRSEHPYTVAAGSANAVSGEISVEYGFRGPSFTISQGCSSASIAIAQGLDLIQNVKADAMIVGGAEAPLNPTVFGAFVRSGILSLRFPFWKDNLIKRDGCAGGVLSEGACVLVIESYERALKRGAHIYAEVLSSGIASDGYHMVLPHPSGRGVALAIRQAIKSAHIEKKEIDFIAGHMPGVKGIYDIEMRILRREFGEKFSQIPITNIKPLIGYTQGACAAFEVAATCLAFHEATQWITYGHQHSPSKASCALINTIGFGGKNVSLILKRNPEI